MTDNAEDAITNWHERARDDKKRRHRNGATNDIIVRLIPHGVVNGSFDPISESVVTPEGNETSNLDTGPTGVSPCHHSCARLHRRVDGADLEERWLAQQA